MLIFLAILGFSLALAMSMVLWSIIILERMTLAMRAHGQYMDDASLCDDCACDVCEACRDTYNR